MKHIKKVSAVPRKADDIGPWGWTIGGILGGLGIDFALDAKKAGGTTVVI